MIEMTLDVRPSRGLARRLTIGIIGFLTLADLFATQAILPALAARYGVAPGAIGIAANAGTIGMAIAGLLAGGFGAGVDRRTGIAASLALLTVPTAALALAPDLMTFALLRIAQGLCMATAFTLTLTYIAEHCSPEDTASSLAAYVTGIVASNLIGRLIASGVVQAAGTEANFIVFAALNLAGAILVWMAFRRAPPMRMAAGGSHFWSAWARHLADPRLVRAFAIGFLILFGFIGVFTYVGFVLTTPPIALGVTSMALVFFCFAPSLITTPLAGGAAQRWGAHRVVPVALLLSVAGLVPLLLPSAWAVFAGLVLVSGGTFFAQAIATGYVGLTAESDRAAASGLYLAAYYTGGLAGAAIVGQLFDRAGWSIALASVAAVLMLAAWLGRGLKAREASNR